MVPRTQTATRNLFDDAGCKSHSTTAVGRNKPRVRPKDRVDDSGRSPRGPQITSHVILKTPDAVEDAIEGWSLCAALLHKSGDGIHRWKRSWSSSSMSKPPSLTYKTRNWTTYKRALKARGALD